jgi:hypothetical protein
LLALLEGYHGLQEDPQLEKKTWLILYWGFSKSICLYSMEKGKELSYVSKKRLSSKMMITQYFAGRGRQNSKTTKTYAGEVV